VAESRVTFLFDENASVHVAHALRELGQDAVHPYDLGLAGQPDEVVLGYAGERGWCVVSSDVRVLHRAHERALLTEHRMGAFFLNDTIRGLCTLSRTIFRHWPEMKRIAGAQPRPFLYLVQETSVTAMRRKRLG
jgi:hypothetical protein